MITWGGMMIPELNGDLLQWLRGFYYVVTTGSVSAAAKIMNRQQSAVTYQIQSLEKELGLLLFSRINNRMVLTEEGKVLFDWSLKIFDAVTGMQEELQGKYRKGTCMIAGSRPTFASKEFLSVINKFHEKWPNIHISLNSAHPSIMMNSIENGDYDFGIIGINYIYNKDKYTYIDLFKSPHLLLYSKNFKFNIDKNKIEESLKNVPYIAFSFDSREKFVNNTFLPHEIDKYIEKYSFLSCSNYYTILKYVRLGFGFTVIDKWSLINFYGIDMDDMNIIDLSSLIPKKNYGIIIRNNSEYSLVKSDFIHLIKEEFSAVHL